MNLKEIAAKQSKIVKDVVNLYSSFKHIMIEIEAIRNHQGINSEDLVEHRKNAVQTFGWDKKPKESKVIKPNNGGIIKM